MGKHVLGLGEAVLENWSQGAGSEMLSCLVIPVVDLGSNVGDGWVVVGVATTSLASIARG